MMPTIRHMDSGTTVVIAKLLTGYVKVTSKVTDIESYIKVNGVFDADYTAYVVSWQGNHGCTADGVIGPDTWAAIAKAAPTCSTSRNRTSGYTLALQLALGGNLTPDAIYGSRTKAAVATYQDAQGMDADGICGPKTWSALIVGEAKPQPTPGTFIQPVDYKQGAKPWGPRMYSNHNDHRQTMANSGCGPTACADAVATLKDPAVDPWTLAQLSMDNGYRTYNSGTAWGFFKFIAEYYGFSKFVQSGSYSALTACLDAGGYVVCSMKKGYWTSSGHFICAWKYDSTYTYANDPASSSRKKQKTAQFKSECKQYFCFYPDEKTEPAKEPTSNDVKRGEKIVDISKYQPDVDYDALISDTALIILRAGYRGTGGGIYQDQKFALHASELKKRGVRFGVYFFSIAKNEAQAQEEARAFWEYASVYDPLFWAMDAEDKSITNGAIREFAGELRRLGAEKVGCYVANHLYDSYGYDSLREAFDFTWIPRYGTTLPAHRCDLWQYTSTGRVDGINGNVDLNAITEQGHDLAWFTGGDGA